MFDERLTTRPPAGAGPLMPTVPVALPSKLMVLGLMPRELRMGTVTLRLAETPPQGPVSAWITAPSIVATGAVPIEKVPEVDPCGITRLRGPVTPAPA